MRMKLLSIFVSGALLGSIPGLRAQDAPGFFSKFQFHANLSQGFLFSSGSNYLTTYSNNGSAKWTEAAVSLSRQVTDRFRAGVQVHSYSLGQLGRQRVTLDWAYVDYQFSPYFGLRLGQVKTPTGLFNEVQDIDAVFPWALLPQGLYAVDYKRFVLSHQGGVIYGRVDLPRSVGSVEYQVYAGRREQYRTETYLAQYGLRLGDCSGPAAGADLRWKSPLPGGLLIGASYGKTNLEAPDARMGSFPVPLHTAVRSVGGYAQWEKGKLLLSSEFRVIATWQTRGPFPETYFPLRSANVMASYRLTEKLTVGSYFEKTLGFLNGGRDRSNPLNYQSNLALSTRYDFTRNFYLKVEGHYLHGNLFGFYQQTNPSGFQKDTRLLAVRIGFAM